MPELSDNDIRLVQRVVRMVLGISGDGVTRDADSIRIKWPVPKPVPQRPADDNTVTVKITDNTSTTDPAGKYAGVIENGNPKGVPAGSMVDGTAVTVYNAVEIGLVTHSGGNPSRFLSTSSIYGGILIGDDGATTPKPAVLVNAPCPFAKFEVTLTQTAGAAGTNSPPAASTYTYTVTSPTGVILGTAMAPTWARQLGHVTAATHGMCHYDISGNLVLTHHDEVIDATNCP